MDDLISRKSVIDALSYCQTYLFDSRDHDKKISLEDAEYTIERLPSAQQWIPCSERLPDKNGKYLVVGRQKAINILKFDGGRWYGKWGVVAWMPMPEPYMEETETWNSTNGKSVTAPKGTFQKIYEDCKGEEE